MTLSPKANFLRSADAKPFADMAASPVLMRAAEVALSELQLRSGKTDPAANWQRLEGAKEFITILLNLPEPNEKRRRGNAHENLTPT